jgi:hypothetical protein
MGAKAAEPSTWGIGVGVKILRGEIKSDRPDRVGDSAYLVPELVEDPAVVSKCMVVVSVYQDFDAEGQKRLSKC